MRHRNVLEKARSLECPQHRSVDCSLRWAATAGSSVMDWTKAFRNSGTQQPTFCTNLSPISEISAISHSSAQKSPVQRRTGPGWNGWWHPPSSHGRRSLHAAVSKDAFALCWRYSSGKSLRFQIAGVSFKVTAPTPTNTDLD